MQDLTPAAWFGNEVTVKLIFTAEVTKRGDRPVIYKQHISGDKWYKPGNKRYIAGTNRVSPGNDEKEATKYLATKLHKDTRRNTKRHPFPQGDKTDLYVVYYFLSLVVPGDDG